MTTIVFALVFNFGAAMPAPIVCADFLDDKAAPAVFDEAAWREANSERRERLRHLGDFWPLD
jgi:hypothetical protein